MAKNTNNKKKTELERFREKIIAIKNEDDLADGGSERVNLEAMNVSNSRRRRAVLPSHFPRSVTKSIILNLTKIRSKIFTIISKEQVFPSLRTKRNRTIVSWMKSTKRKKIRKSERS